MSATAIEVLKNLILDRETPVDLGTLMRRVVFDKNYDLQTFRSLGRQRVLGSLMRTFLFHNDTPFADEIIAHHASHITASQLLSDTEEYRGTIQQNRRIDASGRVLSDSSFYGTGAATHISSPIIELSAQTRGVPIAIIGGGVAGHIAHHALIRTGFRNVLLFERKRYHGIWAYGNVNQGSRNNPRALSVMDAQLSRAPGLGLEIPRFLDAIAKSGRSLKEVKSVAPGYLTHRMSFTDGTEKVFPIVINAMGVGKPRKLSDPERMTTEATPLVAGPRWQQILSAVEVRNKLLVFVGLGNSTAEMIQQVQNFQRDGIDCDYRVITHYPKDSIWNPDDTVVCGGHLFRMFRDLSVPNLTKFQGDLVLSRAAYFQALHNNKIIHGVSHWSVRDGQLQYETFGGGHREFQYDKLYTLIGYEQDPDRFYRMGIPWDHSGNCGKFHYDGEVIDGRVSAGYFGFGSVLESPGDSNATVIPGMIHRLKFMLFSIVLRAEEYVRKAYGTSS